MYLHRWVFTDPGFGVDIYDLFRKFCIEHGIELQSSCGEPTDCVTTEGLPAGMKEEKRVLTIKQIDTGFEILSTEIADIKARLDALEGV